MNGKIVDTTRWTPQQLAVLYREKPSGRLTRGRILSLAIGSDGSAMIELSDEVRSLPYRTRAKYGTKPGEWEFVTPLPEVEELLKILTGEVKPGAPLPPKGKINASDSPDEFVDPLDPKPSRNSSKAPVKGA